MNLILMQNGFPPVIIRKQDRLLYYQHLVTANDGDIRPFIRFIADCAERTLDAYLLATKENSLVPFTSDDENIIAVQVSFSLLFSLAVTARPIRLECLSVYALSLSETL
jgi:hypothetical protein